MDISLISINAGVIALAVWYIKHLIRGSSKQQLISFQEAEKANHSKTLEEIKNQLGFEQEIGRIRFISIYERKINSLLDVYASVQKYEISIGHISRDVIYNYGNKFDELYQAYSNNRDEMMEVFWCNAALFDQSLIENFNDYRNIVLDYDDAYRGINRAETTKSRNFKELAELEIKQNKFSYHIKKAVKKSLKSS